MRTIVLIDGQNLYHLARIAWAPVPADPSSPYSWPSYDVKALAARLTARLLQRNLDEIRFYTGVPAASVDRFWHNFWTNKCRHLRNQGVHVYTGRVNSARQEKGVDVSLALDLIQATHEQRYDAAIIVSQDADFGPAVRLAKKIAHSQGRYLQFESAFPVGAGRNLQTRRARHDVGPHRQGHLRRLPRPTRLPTAVTCISGGGVRRGRIPDGTPTALHQTATNFQLQGPPVRQPWPVDQSACRSRPNNCPPSRIPARRLEG